MRFERGEIEMSTNAGTKIIKAYDNPVYAAITGDEEFRDRSDIVGDRRKAMLIVKVTDIASWDRDQNDP